MGQSTGQKQAQTQLATNNTTAAGALGQINPIYAQMATGADGLTASQKADALTASSSSLGGGQAAAVGAGNLLAARTGNSGGATAAIDDAARTAGTTEASNAVGVQNQSDAIARQNQQTGLSGLNGIYNDANGQASSSLNAYNSAAPSFMKQLALQGIQSAGTASGTIGKAFGV